MIDSQSQNNIEICLFEQKHISAAWKFNTSDKNGNLLDYFSNYIKFTALIDNKEGIGTTYIIYDNKQDIILGFFVLRASTLLLGSEDFVELGYPAIEILELAVDQHYQNSGIGGLIIQYIIGRSINLNKKFLGIKYIVLCAKESAINFYKKFGFRQYGDIPRSYDNKECIPMSLRLKFE